MKKVRFFMAALLLMAVCHTVHALDTERWNRTTVSDSILFVYDNPLKMELRFNGDYFAEITYDSAKRPIIIEMDMPTERYGVTNTYTYYLDTLGQKICTKIFNNRTREVEWIDNRKDASRSYIEIFKDIPKGLKLYYIGYHARGKDWMDAVTWDETFSVKRNITFYSVATHSDIERIMKRYDNVMNDLDRLLRSDMDKMLDNIIVGLLIGALVIAFIYSCVYIFGYKHFIKWYNKMAGEPFMQDKPFNKGLLKGILPSIIFFLGLAGIEDASDWTTIFHYMFATAIALISMWVYVKIQVRKGVRASKAWADITNGTLFCMTILVLVTTAIYLILGVAVVVFFCKNFIFNPTNKDLLGAGESYRCKECKLYGTDKCPHPGVDTEHKACANIKVY